MAPPEGPDCEGRQFSNDPNQGQGQGHAAAGRGQGKSRNQRNRKPKNQGGPNGNWNRGEVESSQNPRERDSSQLGQRRGQGQRRGGRGRGGGQTRSAPRDYQDNGQIDDFSRPPPAFDMPPPSNHRSRGQGQRSARSSEQEAYLNSIRAGVQELSVDDHQGQRQRRDRGNRRGSQTNPRNDRRRENRPRNGDHGNGRGRENEAAGAAENVISPELRAILDAQKGPSSSSQPSKEPKPRSNAQKSDQRKRYAREESIPLDLDLREKLIRQLTRGDTECLICLDPIRPKNAVWDCEWNSDKRDGCFQVFHIHCIKKWSRQTLSDDGYWRCPGCQRLSDQLPSEYRCFCRKARDPEFDRRETPHSCGEVCGRGLRGFGLNVDDCPHQCTELCHPGPCPPCLASVRKTCPCGKSSQTARCGTKISCQNVCEKPLNCSIHECQQPCHEGDCQPCPEDIGQICYCGQKDRIVPCTQETVGISTFQCESVCSKSLECGNHSCQEPCHPGPCRPCQLTPKTVTRCHCGQTSLEKLYDRDGIEPRRSCLDPVPVCGLTCSIKLECGHNCEANCHDGRCPTCPQTTQVKCRCGFMDKEMACAQLKTRKDDARCDKRCAKKRTCGRHKCNQPCCIDIDHVCPLICGKLLSCKSHNCDEPCHRGNCQKCPNVSFDELRCFCGTQVTYPPIQCGTRPPECMQPCLRAHSCDHPVRHNCHSDDRCPPCTSLTEKWCHGNHELRKNVMCQIEGLSCGRPCDRPLPCGMHKCPRSCHSGQCVKANENCAQPCKKPRENCGHPCNAPCHGGTCPTTSCRERIKVQCQCGNRSSSRQCADQTSDYQRLHMSAIMSNLGSSSSIALADIMGSGSSRGQAKAKTGNPRILECNEDCSNVERNKRLALALQIENPERESKLRAPTYSEFLKDFARREFSLASKVHDELTKLVKLAKESKQKSRQFSFDVMNREKRQFVHEYCDHFGVESESFDAEPKRNVVATATRDRVWLPSQSIIDVVMKQRKAPGPVTTIRHSANGMSTLQRSSQIATSSSINSSPSRKPPAAAEIDYFDCDM